MRGLKNCFALLSKFIWVSAFVSATAYSADYRRVIEVECNSEESVYNECSVQGFISEIETIAYRSSPECQFGASWGYAASSVWVDLGCSAVFRVTLVETYRHRLDGSIYLNLQCASPRDLFASCFAGGRILGARLLSQYSAANCAYGRNWGYYNDLLWVDAGCRGNFELNVMRYDAN